MAKIIDNFILIETLGSGTFSETLKGRNLVSKSPVAVKTIKLEHFLSNQLLREMVINEIQLLKRFDHVSILQMLKMLKSSNNIYLIYEYVSGGRFSSLLSKSGFFPESRALMYFKQMLDAVCVVHREDLVHNNLSTETFYLNEDQIKLKNFLIAKASGYKKPVEPELWRFAAPEVLQGRVSSFKSDVYSLGLILYEMIKGQALIECANEREKVLEAAGSLANIEFSEAFSPEIRELIRKMLRTEENERSSLEQVIAEVNALMGKNEENATSLPQNNNNKKLEKALMKERHKIHFVVQNINKILSLNQWVLDFPRNALILTLLKTGLLGLETLTTILNPENRDFPVNFIINTANLDKNEVNSWLSSEFAGFFLKTVKNEKETLTEVISRFSGEESFRQEIENYQFSGLDFMRNAAENAGVYEEKALLRVLYGFASKVYEIISKQKENNSEFLCWEEDVKKEQGILANYLLDVVFFKEFFENFIRNEGRLSEQKYFKHIEGVTVEKLQGMLEKKLAYAKKQLNL